MEDEAQSPPCCYVADGIDFWDPVMMAKELGCRVDELPVYYGGDLWRPDGSDFGYSDFYDDQSELSDYEDPRDFFRDEWLGSCEFHAPDGSYFAVQQDSGYASVSAVDVTCSPEVDFMDPPCCRGPAEL